MVVGSSVNVLKCAHEMVRGIWSGVGAVIHRRTGILTTSISTENTMDESCYHAEELLRFFER